MSAPSMRAWRTEGASASTLREIFLSSLSLLWSSRSSSKVGKELTASESEISRAEESVRAASIQLADLEVLQGGPQLSVSEHSENARASTKSPLV